VDNSNLFDYLNNTILSPLLPAVDSARLTIIQNKADLTGLAAERINPDDARQATIIRLAAKQRQGIELLQQHLKDCMGFQAAGEGGFIARRRHLDALNKAQQCLQQAIWQLEHHGAAELVAEDLRHAHQHLGEITGAFTTDDLLGKIFSSFCIGK